MGCEPWEVIVDVKNVKNPAYQPPGAYDPEDVLVISNKDEIKTLYSYDELGSAKLPSYESLHVIAPATRQSGRDDILSYDDRKKLEETVREIIFDHVGGAT